MENEPLCTIDDLLELLGSDVTSEGEDDEVRSMEGESAPNYCCTPPDDYVDAENYIPDEAVAAYAYFWTEEDAMQYMCVLCGAYTFNKKDGEPCCMICQ